MLQYSYQRNLRNSLRSREDDKFEVSSIETLPSRLIAQKIFSLLSFKERQRIRSASHRWKYIIDKYYGIRVKVTTTDWKWVQWNDRIVFATFATNNNSKKFTNDSTPNSKTLLRNSSLQLLHNPEVPITKSLLVLEIFGESNFEFFIPILAECHNLRCLIVDLRGSTDDNNNQLMPTSESKSIANYGPEIPSIESSKSVVCSGDCDAVAVSSLRKADFFNWGERSINRSNKVWLPNLEKCRIVYPPPENTSEDSSIGERRKRVVYFLFDILQSTKLRKLEFLAEDSFWQLPLEKLFDIHSLYLPRVNIYSQDVNSNYRTNYELPVHRLQYLQFLEFHNDYEINLCFKKRDRFNSGMMLKTFSFRIGSGFNWLPKAWWIILNSQQNLQELNYQLHFSNEMKSEVLRILNNSQLSLRVLKLHGINQLYAMDSFDGGWFHRLMNLEHLELLGETSKDKVLFRKPLPMLARPWNLPSSLRKLVVHGPIDCGRIDPAKAMGNLTSLCHLELMGRYRSPWFVSDWKPIFEMDLGIVGTLFRSMSSLECLKLLYQQPKHRNRTSLSERRLSTVAKSFDKPSFTNCWPNDDEHNKNKKNPFRILTYRHSYLDETVCSEILKIANNN